MNKKLVAFGDVTAAYEMFIIQKSREALVISAAGLLLSEIYRKVLHYVWTHSSKYPN
jgi:hypothetical protein